MALLDVATQNKSLNNDYGATKGPNAAASHNVALFAGDPRAGGVEVAGGGYARVALTNNGTNWPAASAGAKTAGVDVVFPASTGAWTGSATHFVLFEGADRWDSGRLGEPVTVAQAGVVVRIRPTVFYNNEGA